MRKRLFRSTLLAIAASLGIGIASLTGLTALATETEDNTSNDAETGSFTATNSDVSTRSLATQATNESGGSSSRTGMGYVWTYNISGSTSHWLGAFNVGNGLEWCIDFSTGAPTGAGTLVTDLTPSYYGPSSYKNSLSVTNAQMGWILNTYQDTNTATSRAAIAVIVHANYESGDGQKYIPTLINQLASSSDGKSILETAAQYVDDAKEAGVVGVYSSAGTNENTRAQVTNIGVKNGKGEWVAGRDFTLTISGDAVWDSVSGYTISSDGKTLSGTTKSSALSFWLTATGTGTVKTYLKSDLTATYEIVSLGRTASQSTIRQEGYTDSDPITALAGTFDLIYDFQPLATSKTENIQKGQEIVDTLEVSADETYHNGTWPQVDGENIAVTLTGTAYYLGTTRTDEALDEVPEDAQVVATATIEANGPGTYEVSTNTTAETSGYVTWVWEINKTNNTRTYTVGSTTYTAGDFIHSDWSDSYNLEDETLYYIMQFQPILTSSVANCKVNDPVEDGQTQTLCDTLEVATDNVSEGLNGERAGTAWPQIDGENIAVTFEGTAYYTGEHPAEETNEVPEDAIVAARTSITVTEPGSYDIEADLIGDYDPSFITWVWEVSKETNQQHTYTVFGEEISSADFIVDDWADAYGLEDETLVNRWQAHVVSSISFRETADGTYLVDDLWVTGLPSDHGEWEGTCTTSTTSSTCFEADVATFTQSLYFFPKDVEVSEENKDQATLIGSEEVSATNGFHATVGSTQWLWPQDEDGNNLEGTVVFQTSFAGDDRVAPYMSDITDKTEQISNFTLGIASLATTEDESQKIIPKSAGSTISDRVTLTGLEVGTKYLLVGELIDTSTGKRVSGTKTSEVSFTAESTSMELEQEFTVDAATWTSDVVVFEYLYSSGELVANDTDLENESQTVYVSGIGTTALDGEDGDKSLDASDGVTIIDTVSYSNLLVGKEYELTGKLMVKSTGQPLTDSNGNEITSTITFTPSSSSGTVQVSFTFDATNLAGESIVVFEYLYLDGIEVATHADIEDEGQTVTVGDEDAAAAAIAQDNDSLALTGAAIAGGLAAAAALTGAGSYLIYRNRKTSAVEEIAE